MKDISLCLLGLLSLCRWAAESLMYRCFFKQTFVTNYCGTGLELAEDSKDWKADFFLRKTVYEHLPLSRLNSRERNVSIH